MWPVYFVLVLNVLLFCHGDPVSVYDQIYTKLGRSKPCTRLLNTTGVIGCNTPREGASGTLRYFPSKSVLDAYLQTVPPDSPIAALLPSSLFDRETIGKLNVHSQLAGVMLLASSLKNYPPFFSHDLKSPQQSMSLHPENDFAWNEYGSGMAYDNFPFALILLSNSESNLMLKYAGENEAAVANGKFPDRHIEFKYKMYAEVNSIDCLQNNMCLPLGGYSVWASMGSGRVNGSLPAVVVTAALDGFSLFHDAATAAEASMSGVVALLAAADALSRRGISAEKLDREVILSFFQGEKWGYVGSRNWLSEIESFQCDVLSSSGSGCDEPHRESLEFTRLNISQFHRVLDLSQLALADGHPLTVYMHNERPVTPELAAFQEDIAAIASRMEMVAELANSSTPGLPPSPGQSFYRVRPDLPVVTLADHSGAFKNKYFGSEFDDIENANGHPTDPRAPDMPLCKVASLAARVIYQSASLSADNETIDSITADCDLVAALWICLTKDFSCDLANALMPNFQRSPTGEQVNHYTSVYQIQEYSKISGTPLFVKLALAAMPLNFTSQPTWTQQYRTHFHDAVDPGLKFDFDQNQWIILNSSQSPLWTESNWGNDIGSRVYRAEDPSVVLFMGIAGGACLVGALLVVHFSKKVCAKRFKTL